LAEGKPMFRKSRIFQSFFIYALFSATAASAPCASDALGVRRTLTFGAQGGLEIGLKSYPRTLDLADHEIILTFDDGPAPGTTAKVLDALVKECVKATFFLIGRNAESMPWLAKRIAAEGHTIAHHTYSHPAATLRGLDETQARREIDRGIAAVERAAYGANATPPHTRFFRFPGFADSPALNGWLASRDIAVIGTDLWASDWTPMTPEAQLTLLLDRVEKNGRGIVLMHDIKRQTAAMLPNFLRQLKKRGFSIVHIVPGMSAAPLRSAPPGWRSATDQIRPKLSKQPPTSRRPTTKHPSG
jgi:peptidoglycan/xylan/chitin deacetylase (PgdA/CDA1 family)